MHIPDTPEELKGRAAEFFSTISRESDRGCVLVAAAFLDEALELLLQSRMTRDAHLIKSCIEPLFTGSGPLKSFSAKTELCRALMVVREHEYMDLTRTRSLRNHFARSYVNATFEDPTVVEIVSELHHFGVNVLPPNMEESARAGHVRNRFSLAAAWLAGSLHERAEMATADHEE